MPNEAAYLCPTTAGQHHYHAERQLYVGSRYISLCCHCGRVQMIVYRGRTETPDLHYMGGAGCGSFQK